MTPPGGTARNFTYDAAGNVKTDTRFGALGMSFEYDVEGRLSKAWQTNAPTIGGTYRYDARSRLVSRTVTQTAVTTLYVHDLDDHIIAETDASGQTLREYIWLGDIPLAVVDKVATGSPVIYYVHADHLGRPARMTAQNQAWVWDVIYSPFGETSYIWTNPGTLDIRFPGQWFQLESGLAYNWHRHYDASLGRYVQPDPLGLAGGRSLYGYVNGNPLASVDPSGLISLSWLNPTPLSREDCRALRDRIYEKNEALRNELQKYDPIKDAQGGWFMQWGNRVTKPGGHYQEITDLQRGLKKDLETYNKRCGCDDDNPPITRNVDALANRFVPKPPGLNLPFGGWFGLPGAGGVFVPAIP